MFIYDVDLCFKQSKYLFEKRLLLIYMYYYMDSFNDLVFINFRDYRNSVIKNKIVLKEKEPVK